MTPDDEYAFVGDPPLWLPDNISEVHVSVTFTWDIDEGKRLVGAWKIRLNQDGIDAPVKIGGPAIGSVGGEFVPNRYLKPGVVITSRGCQNRCWFCSVWKREPKHIELPIVAGHIIQDDNLLACSEEHIRAVFDMLKRQKKRSIFSGGIEAKLLRPWHIELFDSVNPRQIFMAYDTPDDLEPLIRARKLFGGKYTRHTLFCYVLIGGPKDTITEALERLETVKSMDICPFAMLYRSEKGKNDHYNEIEWRRFQREWSRPSIIYAVNKKPVVGGFTRPKAAKERLTSGYEATAEPTPKSQGDFSYPQDVIHKDQEPEKGD